MTHTASAELPTDRGAQIASVAVIIVNYGTPDLTIAGIQSVLERTHGSRQIEVHVVDNASPDDSAERLAAAHAEQGWGGRVTLYLETENHGFGRGNNVVLQALQAREESPDAVFLLNPDARLENEAIDLLAQALEANPSAGFAGAGISKPDGTDVTAAFRFPSVLSEFSSALSFGPVARLLDRWTVALPPNHPEGPVGWVAGAAVLMRQDTLQAIQNFDPGFFLYYEEVDLMRRGRDAGWTCLYVPRARVVHIEGEATGVKSGRTVAARLPDYRYDSWQYYFRKAHGRAGALLAAAALLLGSAGNCVISVLRRRPRAVPEAFFGDFLRHGLRPLLAPPHMRAVSMSQNPDDPFAENDGTKNRNPSDISLGALIAEDFRTHDRDLFAQGFWVLFWHRFGNWRMGIRTWVLRLPASILYKVMAKLCEWVCGIYLPYTVHVGRRVRLEHFGGMILVAHTIGDDVIIRQNTTFGISGLDDLTGRPIIGNKVEIGAGAVIIGRIHVGYRAIVGANAVVVRDVPPSAVVGGIPARLLKPIPES